MSGWKFAPKTYLLFLHGSLNYSIMIGQIFSVQLLDCVLVYHASYMPRAINLFFFSQKKIMYQHLLSEIMYSQQVINTKQTLQCNIRPDHSVSDYFATIRWQENKLFIVKFSICTIMFTIHTMEEGNKKDVIQRSIKLLKCINRD